MLHLSLKNEKTYPGGKKCEEGIPARANIKSISIEVGNSRVYSRNN